MQNRISEDVRINEWSAGARLGAMIWPTATGSQAPPTRPAIPTDTECMQIERDKAGRVHIEDDGVSAIIDERGGQSSFSMTPTASEGAVKRVCEVIEDRTQWPTMPLPRLDFDPGTYS